MSEKIYDELEEYLKSGGLLGDYGEFKKFKHEVYFHQIMETDFICIRETPSGLMRRYIFELKETDFNKVVSQVMRRKNFTDYIYIVMVNDTLSHFCHKFGEWFGKLNDSGIGVLYYNGNFHNVLRAKWQKYDKNYETSHGKGWKDFYPNVFGNQKTLEKSDG